MGPAPRTITLYVLFTVETNKWFNIRTRFQKLVFPQGISYDRETGFGTVTLGRIFKLSQTYTLTHSPLVDPTGFEPVTSTLQMWRSTN